MSNTDTLVDEWGEDNVAAAFWLQQKIKDDGLDGIGYMEAARNRLRSNGEQTVREKMKQKMNNDY